MKKIITTDVDFVLLDWVAGLKPFFAEKGIDDSHLDRYFGSTYYPTLEELFKISDEEHCIQLMKEFNVSPHIAHLPVFQKEAVETFKNLHDDGFEIIAVTCVGGSEQTHKMRTRNLQENYGDVFNLDRVICVPVRTSKEPYLKKIQERGEVIMFIDDREGHLQEARNLSIKPVLYSNDGKETTCSDTILIDCLTKVSDIAYEYRLSVNNKRKINNQLSVTKRINIK